MFINCVSMYMFFVIDQAVGHDSWTLVKAFCADLWTKTHPKTEQEQYQAFLI